MNTTLRHQRAALCAALVSLLLAACGSSPTRAPVEERTVAVAESLPKDVYVVKKGDTLYGIALDHGVDYKDIVAWNNIDNPNRILVGQQLRLSGSAKAAPEAVGAAPVAVAQPINAPASVEKRSLDDKPLKEAKAEPAANSSTTTASTAAACAGGNGEKLKREPKAGKEVYSDAAWAQAMQTSPAATGTVTSPATSSATAPATSTTAARSLPAAAETAREGVEKAAEKTVDKAGEKPIEKAAASELTWAWPANGKLLAGFKEGSNKGVDIAGRIGEPVQAAADGKVAYIGTGIASLGKLVIVRHDGTYLSAYAHNSNVLVKEGDEVKRGQKIAEIGNSGTDAPKLHFEIRKQGTPVDPAQFLPKR